MATEVSGPPPEALVERFQELNAGLEKISDPVVRQRAEEMIGVVLDLYGEGLRRIFDALSEAGDPATEELLNELSEDGVVASLMLIHDLYPVPLPERVEEALDSVRPYMDSHGGNVELLSVTDGVARIKLGGSCDGCPASAATLELAIKQALDEHAPDLDGLEVEGAVADAEPEVTGHRAADRSGRICGRQRQRQRCRGRGRPERWSRHCPPGSRSAILARSRRAPCGRRRWPATR